MADLACQKTGGLFHLGLEHNLAVPLLQAVARSNEAHKLRQLEQIKKATTTQCSD